jgi:multidrug efflux system outer membrane protein
MANAAHRALRLGAFAALSVLESCAVGPNYALHQPPVDAGFLSAGASTINAGTPSPDIATFWRLFNDPALTQLVERALAVNGDVRIAQGRLREARATLTGVHAGFSPDVGVVADADRSLAPSYLFPGQTRAQRQQDVFDAGFVAHWELDVFGRNRRADESAAAQVQGSQAAMHAVLASVAADVARNYLDLRGQQQRLVVTLQALQNQHDTVRLTEARWAAGRGSMLDVARARTLAELTKATLPLLQAALEHDAFRLATLTARSPRETLAQLAEPRPLPELPVTDLSKLPLGTPEQLLRRRPDIIVAERQLAASTAAIGIATADLFPRISLSGLIGFSSTRVASFSDSGSQQYSVGAGLTWPLLDFGRVRARIDASQARNDQALANYEQTVSIALEEAEGTLSRFTRDAQQAERLSRAVVDAEDASRLSRLRFEAGSTDLLVLLDAQRQTLAARDLLAQAQTNEITDLVNVYRALGGGWSADELRLTSAKP